MDINLPYISLNNDKNSFENYEELRKEIDQKLFVFDLEFQIATIAKFVNDENKNLFGDDKISKMDIWFEDDSAAYIVIVFYDKEGNEIEQYEYMAPELTTLQQRQIKKILDGNIYSGVVEINTLLLDLYKTFFGPEEGARYYNEKKSVEFGEKLDMTLENKPEKKSLKL